MLDKKYNHKTVEKGKYDYWKKEGLFLAEENSNKKPFSVILPPPNITGKLHLGHAWDGTLQDIVVRYKKLDGFNTLWVPGMDHAGISMQRKVEERLRKKGVDTINLSEEDFLKAAFEWKAEHEGIIRKQWAQLGLALDYTKEKFTMDDDMNLAVKTAFVKMYEKGIIYRGKKVVNWDPVQETAVSNIEVIHKEVESKFYHFAYDVVDSEITLEVATTRPETMFADTCIIVNPSDDRYKEIVGKFAINPANGDKLPIITDEYVDITFGSGAMKCTPAHDFNDYELGLKHNQKMPVCMNPNGTMNELANEFVNQDRFECRENLVAKLEKEGKVIKIQAHTNQVGHSERSGAIIEPYLSNQWFVKMDDIAKNAIEFQKSKEGEVEFFPKRFQQTYFTWMENVYDWCISRQLKWGHKIPAWTHNQTGKIYVGLQPPIDIENYTQDKDVLDTWFSSGLWPFSTLGWGNKDDKLLKEFFPTNLLVTGYDIIFFWVARMMFQSKEFTGKKPFEKLLVHGLVRAADGSKMSKSLGNGIDPIDVIEKYGTDSLRYFLSTNSAPGQDLRYDETKVESSWNFINKLWNTAIYVEMSIDESTTGELSNNLSELDTWIVAKLDERLKRIKKAMENFEFGIANKEIYNFVYNEFASVYIELSKVDITEGKEDVKNTLKYILMQVIKILHPYIPFVTEHIFQNFNPGKSIMREEYPKIVGVKENDEIEILNEFILAIRQLRSENNIKTAKEIDLVVDFKNDISLDITNYVKKIVNANILNSKTKGMESVPFNSGVIYIKLSDYIDTEELKSNINKQLSKLKIKRDQLIVRVSDKEFLNKAPKDVVLSFEKELDSLKKQIKVLEGELKKIGA